MGFRFVVHPTRFTPTGVGTTESLSGRIGRPVGSPPQAWGQRLPVNVVMDELSVHPHRRGDNVFVSTGRYLDNRFTPTGVGTTPQTIAHI